MLLSADAAIFFKNVNADAKNCGLSAAAKDTHMRTPNSRERRTHSKVAFGVSYSLF